MTEVRPPEAYRDLLDRPLFAHFATVTPDGANKVKITAGLGGVFSDTEEAQITQTGPQTISRNRVAIKPMIRIGHAARAQAIPIAATTRIAAAVVRP